MKIIIAAATGTERKFIRRYLEFAGYRGASFMEAWNEDTIIERANCEAVDIIFLDLDWKKLKLTRIIKQLDSKHKIVALTSYAGFSRKQHILDLGIALVIRKPLSAEKIRNSICCSPLSSSLSETCSNSEGYSPFTNLFLR